MDTNILFTAIRAALQAGAEIMKVYTDPNADFEIEKKADNSPLTIADRKSHAIIAGWLAAYSVPYSERRGKENTNRRTTELERTLGGRPIGWY